MNEELNMSGMSLLFIVGRTEPAPMIAPIGRSVPQDELDDSTTVNLFGLLTFDFWFFFALPIFFSTLTSVLPPT